MHYFDEVVLNWLVELLALVGRELVLLPDGEGGGGRPTWCYEITGMRMALETCISIILVN